MIIHGNLNKFKLKLTQSSKNKKLWDKNFLKISKFHFLKSAVNKWRNYYLKNIQLYKRILLGWLVKKLNLNLKLCSTPSLWWNKNLNKIHNKFKNLLISKIILLLYQLKCKEWKFRWLKSLMFIKYWKNLNKRSPKIKWTKDG